MLITTLLEQEQGTSQEINIPGYGQMTLDTAKTNAISRIEKALNYVKSNPNDPIHWKNAKEVLIDSGVLPSMMDAIINSTEPTE